MSSIEHEIEIIGQLTAGPIVAGDYTLGVRDIEGGHQLVIAKGGQIETLDVMDGVQGERGEQGIQGEQGPRGERGETGEQGPRGERGERGPIGYNGEQGPKGDTGDTGPRGEKGEKGDKGDKGDQGDRGIVGPQGERGPQGETGPQGEQGPQGIQGERGEQGETGPQGETGLQGPQGPVGATGPQGPAGQDAVVDATLTQAGQAADAKATGDEITGIKDAYSQLPKSISAGGTALTPDTDGMVNIPYATNNIAGIAKTSSGYAFNTNTTGYATCAIKSLDAYHEQTELAFISKGTLENVREDIVHRSLLSNSQITSADLPSIQETLGIVTLTQEEYDLMASHDANTLYIIVAGDAS